LDSPTYKPARGAANAKESRKSGKRRGKIRGSLNTILEGKKLSKGNKGAVTDFLNYRIKAFFRLDWIGEEGSVEGKPQRILTDWMKNMKGERWGRGPTPILNLTA